MMNFIRNHWKLVSGLTIAVLMGIITIFLIALFPPTLPFLITLAPFAVLATLPPAAGALAGGGIAAALVLAICLAFNITVHISNFLDKILPVNEEESSEEEEDDYYYVKKNPNPPGYTSKPKFKAPTQGKWWNPNAPLFKGSKPVKQGKNPFDEGELSLYEKNCFK